MSYSVIAVHSIVHVPEGEKKQVTVAPGAQFSLANKADYEHLIGIGAVKDAGKATKGDDAEKAAAEKAAAEKAATEKAAAEKAKSTKGGKPTADDVVG